MTDTKQRLLDAAERGIRRQGYNGVSFRDLAAELGIKSASVHYHFAKKEDMGLALINRYAARFFDQLNEQSYEATSPQAELALYCAAYRSSLTGADAICLGGMLGAETGALPDELARSVASFFQTNIDWLISGFPEEWPMDLKTKRAAHIVASLQGAMMLATAMKDVTPFDRVVANILGDFDGYIGHSPQ